MLASEDEQHQEQGGGSSAARPDLFPLVLFSHCIKNANGGILEKSKLGIGETEEIVYD